MIGKGSFRSCQTSRRRFRSSREQRERKGRRRERGRDNFISNNEEKVSLFFQILGVSNKKGYVKKKKGRSLVSCLAPAVATTIFLSFFLSDITGTPLFVFLLDFVFANFALLLQCLFRMRREPRAQPSSLGRRGPRCRNSETHFFWPLTTEKK